MLHYPVTLTSNWLVNSCFIMVVGEIFFKVQSEIVVQGTTKKFLKVVTVLKLFRNQSEMSALPEGSMQRFFPFY